MTAERVVVVGIGNPWRRDDGAGPAIAAAVRDRMDDRVEVLELDGETARLIDAWDGADLAVVVDAIRTGATPGTVHRLDAHGQDVVLPCDVLLPDARAIAGLTGQGTSSHGLGVAQAVELARTLGRLPRRLVLVGVEGAEFGPGSGLTAAVAAAVEPAARLVAGLVEGRA